MKLRLENGNFSIKATLVKDDGQTLAPVYSSLPTGLKQIDFLGAVVEFDNGDAYIVSGAFISAENDDILQLMGGDSFFYNPLNGKVGITPDAVLDGGSDDSGSGGEEGK